MHPSAFPFRSVSTALTFFLPLSRIVLFAALLAILLLAANGASPLSAATGSVLDSFTAPSPSNAGRGLTFDGDHLWYAPKNETTLYRITVSDHSNVPIVTDLPRQSWALAWDGEELWAAVDTEPTSSVEKFYTVNRVTGAATWRFDVDLAAPSPPIGDPQVDGFAYDFTTGTFWVSEDGAETIFNISRSGAILRQFQISGFSSYNSGIATDGTTLWLATFECCSPWDFRIKHYYPDGTLIDQILLSGSTNLREDMDFDPISFRNQSKCAIWATQGVSSNPNIVAYEVPCDPGGYDSSHYGSLSSEANPSVGDPVNPIFGNFNHQQTDLSIPTRGLPLEFMRTYNSAASAVDGPLGFGWTHNYNMHLEFETGAVVVVQPDGRKDRYLSLGGGAYQSPPDFFDSLQESGGIYTLTLASQVKYTFNSAGKLTSIADRNNNTTNLAYYVSGPDTGRLETVTEPTGRTFTFTYTSGRILRVTESAPLSRYVEFTYDINGNLQTVRDVNGGITTYTYSSAHQLEKAKDSNNNWSVQNCYDSSTGKVIKQFGAPFPNSLEPPSSNCLLDRAGANAAGLLLTEFQYNTPGVGQATLRDPRNFATVYKFDNLFRVTKITDALGGVTEYTYDSHSNRTCVKDPRGNRTSYSYDTKGNVTQKVDAQHTDASCNLKPPPDNKAWTYAYTFFNDIASEVDPLNRETQYVYDSVGNLMRTLRLESVGGNIRSLTCFEYHDGTAPGRQTAILKSTDLVRPVSDTADCTGNRTKFEYNDAYDNLTATINPEFSGAGTPKTTFAVDAGGRTTSVTNELTHTTTNSYDSRGALLSTTDQLGNTTSFTYDSKGNLKTVTDGNRKVAGVESEASSGSCGALGTGDGFDNDPTPSDDDIVDDGCPSTKYEYDGGDRLKKVIDAIGNVTEYRYDANGNRTDLVPPNRQPRNTAETQCGTLGVGDYIDDDPLDDGSPNPPVVDDGCPSTKYEYDALNRVISEIRPGSAAPGCASPPGCVTVTRYQYDATGNKTGVVDAKHAAVNAAEAGAGPGQPCGEFGGGDGADSDGDTFVDDGCPANLYRFDELNRLKRVEHWGGGVLLDAVDYTFDLVGNRKTMTDSTGLTTYDYDALNRLSTFTTPAVTASECTTQPNCSKTVSYGYETTTQAGEAVAAFPGQRTQIVYPDRKANGAPETGAQCGTSRTGDGSDSDGDTKVDDGCPSVVYTYFKDDRMKTVTDWLNKTTQYTYNNARFLSSTAFPSPAGSVAYAYDNAERVSQVTHQLITSESLTYVPDAIGNVTQVTRTNENPEKYTYDPLQRLKKVEYPDTQVINYTYDANGNRKTLDSSTSGLLNYNYDAGDQLTQVGGTTYASDANGNLSSRGTEAYQYDHENRLTKITFEGYDPAATAAPVNISSSAVAFPTTITTASPHGLTSGDTVLVRGHAGSTPDINGEWTASVVTSTTFTIPVNVTTGGTGGTALRKRPCYDFVGDSVTGTGQGMVAVQDLTSFIAPVRRLDTSPGNANYDPYWDTVPGKGLFANVINATDLTRMLTPASERDYNKHCPRVFAYNGDGMRVKQTLGRFATDYVWDTSVGTPMVLQETNREDLLRFSSDPLDTAVYRTRSDYKYVYGLGLVSITDGQGNQRYVLPDALGSARMLSTGADGSAYATYSYDAFGSPRSQDGPHTTFRFTGEQYDLKARQQGLLGVSGTNGLYYLRARYYDPTIGRFLTRDPLRGSLGDPQSLNAYPYVQNNPVNRVDPTGLFSEGFTAECISFGLAVAIFMTAALVAALFDPALGVAIGVMFGALSSGGQYALGNEEAGASGAGRTTSTGLLFLIENIFGPQSPSGQVAGGARVGLGVIFLGSSGLLCLASQP